MSTRMSFANAFGNLWLRQEWDYRKPLRPGAAYEASGRSIDIYERRDRTVILTETVLRDETGEIAVVQRHHQSFVLDQSEGRVTLREPDKKEGREALRTAAGRTVRAAGAHDSRWKCAAPSSTATATTTPTSRPPKSWASKMSWSAAR